MTFAKSLNFLAVAVAAVALEQLGDAAQRADHCVIECLGFLKIIGAKNLDELIRLAKLSCSPDSLSRKLRGEQSLRSWEIEKLASALRVVVTTGKSAPAQTSTSRPCPICPTRRSTAWRCSRRSPDR